MKSYRRFIRSELNEFIDNYNQGFEDDNTTFFIEYNDGSNRYISIYDDMSNIKKQNIRNITFSDCTNVIDFNSILQWNVTFKRSWENESK